MWSAMEGEVSTSWQEGPEGGGRGRSSPREQGYRLRAANAQGSPSHFQRPRIHSPPPTPCPIILLRTQKAALCQWGGCRADMNLLEFSRDINKKAPGSFPSLLEVGGWGWGFADPCRRGSDGAAVSMGGRAEEPGAADTTNCPLDSHPALATPKNRTAKREGHGKSRREKTPAPLGPRITNPEKYWYQLWNRKRGRY